MRGSIKGEDVEELDGGLILKGFGNSGNLDFILVISIVGVKWSL